MFVLRDISPPMLPFWGVFGISKGLDLMVKQLGRSVVGKDTCLAYSIMVAFMCILRTGLDV